MKGSFWQHARGLAIVPLAILALAACSGGSPVIPAKPTPTAAPAGKAGSSQGGQIVAEGKVVPANSASLSFGMGGIVASVPITAGAKVTSGQVLAQLDTGQLTLQLAQADANLTMAKAKRDQGVAGPTAADAAAAQQSVSSAQAAYDKLKTGPTSADVAAAQSALAAAQQNYAKVKAGPTKDQLAALAAQVGNARAALDQAQAAYDQVKSNAEIAMLPQSLQLQQATNNFNAATAAYKDAATHPTPAELAAAAAQVQSAQAALDKLTPDSAALQAAMTALETAKAQQAKLQPSPADKAVLDAAVNAAQASRDLAAQQLKSATLTAPFAGSVATVAIHPGEYATPGVEAMRLADTSNWRIETTDLTELNIVQVQAGTPVSMTFDAIPGLELPGHVSGIGAFGDTRQGDIVYTVTIVPDNQDPRLRWNMTAKVSIESK
ncbi:MAG TPA: efflux RND transporter periplasmic adaptor subunit [Anaerolineae bacterium]